MAGAVAQRLILAESSIKYVVAGFSPRSTHWKLTRAEARDYMITATFWSNRELDNSLDQAPERNKWHAGFESKSESGGVRSRRFVVILPVQITFRNFPGTKAISEEIT